uniref:NADH dehydrogenase subunit 5 n=1 Tax=Cerogria janthinipennis TaxID=1304780 RepID=UPI0022059CC3|nr:NADH dehydrogenase subunit 5 [Cerogria janthinipennis]UYB79037.1 NADH dehydrogenase subunit 5 [Cerogria janthinipennis]
MNICIYFFFMFFIMSMLLFILSMKFIMLNDSIFMEIEMINMNSSSIMMTLFFDWMTLLFMSFVLYISSMVILYSKSYMNGDLNLKRFIMMIMLFVLSMMLLIVSPNLISILLGWDGLGLISYCLVIYYQNIKSFNAGMLTVLSNRIGDVSLILAISWFMNFGSWNFIFYMNELKENNSLFMINMLIIVAAMTKSAQIPFSSWLPAAMAAPTPVSSLVHSSTLVTAGVYLLIRFNNSFNSKIMYIILFFSLITMFMSGLSAGFEFDLKKIIALSTLSQLGFMISILMLGDSNLAFFHLLTHALFKALLFMCAGNIIHNLNNHQDIRFMGNSVKNMPMTCSILNISNLSLCGIPFLSGFYSKDLIMESLFMNYMNIFIFLIFFMSIGLTTFYSFRLFYYSCFSNFNMCSLNNIKDQLDYMSLTMIGLALPVIFMGSAMSWTNFKFYYFIIMSYEMKNLTISFVILGMILALILNFNNLNYPDYKIMNYKFSLFNSSMWNLYMLSTKISYPIKLGNSYYMKMDQGWMENYSGQKIFYLLMNKSKFYQLIFNNNIKIFIMLFILLMTMILMF